MADQETYLNSSSIWRVLCRGIKKMIVEITSVKFWLLGFICFGISQKFIADTVGLGSALLLIGIREVPVDAIMNKVTSGLR